MNSLQKTKTLKTLLLLKLQQGVFLLFCPIALTLTTLAPSFAKDDNLVVGNNSIKSNAKENRLLLKEAKWLADSSDKAVALTQRLSECLNPQAPPISKLGKIAFESQALLGGQAAKMSLTCASCHPSGRTNPDFFLESISGQPGTADVSHSFFSSTGGNDTLTPVPIPDLAKLNESTIKDRQSDTFRQKLTQLIEVEFDGQKANQEVLNGLQAYLVNTNINFCDENFLQPISLDGDWKQLLETVAALSHYPIEGTNTFIIRSARKRIETVYWRFKNINDTDLEIGLIQLSRQLESLSLEKVNHLKQTQALIQWQISASKLYVDLKKRQKESTYNPEVITQLVNSKKERHKRK